MPVTSSDIFRLAHIKMAGSPPAVPSNPAMKVARITGESLNFQPTVTTSNELDPSGQLKDSILTGANSSGGVDMELTKHVYLEEVMAAVFRNTWGVGEQGDGTLPFDGEPVGPDELIVGKNLDLFMIEKQFQTPGGEAYHRFDRSAYNSFSISIAPNSPITVAIDVSGGPMVLSDDAIAGTPTFADAGVNPVFTAPEVVEISIGGVPSTLCFNQITLNHNSNVRAIECIGTLGVREQAIGRFEASIEGSAYFVSNDLLETLISQESQSVSVTLEDSLGNQYTFFYPRCKMTAGSANAAGTGQDVVASVSFQPLYDPSWGFSARVTRVTV